MVVESRDAKTGITRHEFGTTNYKKCRQCIEATGFVKQKFEGNNVTRYLAEYKGVPFEIRSSPARTIIYSPNRYALTEFESLLQLEEWEYDDSVRTDYLRK